MSAVLIAGLAAIAVVLWLAWVVIDAVVSGWASAEDDDHEHVPGDFR